MKLRLGSIWSRGSLAGTALLALAAFTTAGSDAAYAQQDTKLVRLIVSFGSGGTNDVLARIIAEKLSPKLGKQVIVEPRPGGGGLVAARYVASAAPDGSTILMSTGSLTIQSAKQTPPIDVNNDLVPVVQLHRGTHTLYVNSSLPIKSFADLVTYSKANPDKLAFASFGVGSQTHLVLELFKQRTGMQITHVPYRSNQETKLAVVKNESQLALEPYPTLKPFIEKGEVLPLALISAESDVPGLPGMRGVGMKDIDVYFWFGFHLPPKTPADIVAAYNKAVNEILKEPELVEVIAKFGAKPVGGTVAEFDAMIRSEVKVWSEVIKQANLVFD